MQLGVVRSRVTVYWVPILKWDGDYVVFCPACQASALLDRDQGRALAQQVGTRRALPPPRPETRSTTGWKDPWTVLGVAPGATLEEIKDAYRTRAFLLHPDAHAGASDKVHAAAQAAMVDLNEAYAAVLATNPRER
jgi:DnaJ-domain-containing protein 1